MEQWRERHTERVRELLTKTKKYGDRVRYCHRSMVRGQITLFQIHGLSNMLIVNLIVTECSHWPCLVIFST
jgi:hypothetical protein